MADRKIAWIAAGLALALIGLAFFFYSEPGRGLSWRTTFSPQGRNPYDTYALRELLHEPDRGRRVVLLTDSLRRSLPGQTTGTNYVFIGEAQYAGPDDIDWLVEFVARGNTAIIASRYLDDQLAYLLFEEDCGIYYLEQQADPVVRDSAIRVSLLNEAAGRSRTSHRFVFVEQFAPAQYEWRYFTPLAFCENGLQALGMLNDSSYNFARRAYGEGAFYLHTHPILFTNYYLMQAGGRDYAEAIFSHLRTGPVYWDEYSRVPENFYNSRNQQPNTQHLREEHALQYILQQPPLAWAWYLLLLLGLLYLLFRTKRRQRVVPVLFPNVNSSREYLATLARLHYLQGDHLKLAHEEIKLFSRFLRERYAISWNEDRQAFGHDLTARTGVPETIVQEALTQIAFVKGVKLLDAGALLRFHRALADFYRATQKQEV